MEREVDPSPYSFYLIFISWKCIPPNFSLHNTSASLNTTDGSSPNVHPVMKFFMVFDFWSFPIFDFIVLNISFNQSSASSTPIISIMLDRIRACADGLTMI